jgi:hypothetical protein
MNERKGEYPVKNRIAFGAGAILSGALLAAGPWSLFKICSQAHHAHEGHSVCFYTARAEIGIGALAALLGIAYMLFRDKNVRAGLSFAVSGDAALSLVVANFLIGMDPDPMMACRTAALPALNVISALVLVFAAANAVWLLTYRRGGSRGSARAPSHAV